MNILMRKIKRDLFKMWTQFLSVFLMAFLGVAIYSAMEGVWFGMDTEVKKFYEETNLASSWVYGKDLTSEDLDKIKAIDYVEDASLSMTTNVKMKINNASRDEKEPDIKIMEYTNTSISNAHNEDGTDFSLEEEGLWLNSNLAEKRDIKVGDKVTLVYGSRESELEVKGIVVHPEYVYYTGSSSSVEPDFNQYGYGMISESTAKKFLGKTEFNEMRISISKDGNTKELKEEVESILNERYLSFYDKDNMSSVLNFDTKIEQIKKMSIMFSTIFICLAVLTMLTTMTRLVENQRIQIGTLKALGFSDWTIKLHYSLYGLIVGLTGGVLGLIIAPRVLSPIMLKIQTSIYKIPVFKAEISYASYLVVVLLTLACVVATLFACRKDLREMPAETMRGAAPKAGKIILFEKFTGFWRKLSFGWKWSLRDISRSKIRSLMGIVGVFGCMMLLMGSLGIRNSLEEGNKFIYKTQYTYTTKAYLSPTTMEENRNKLLQVVNDENAQWIQETSVNIKVNNIEKTSLITVMDKGNYINLKNESEDSVEIPKEGILLSRMLANKLNISKGDEIEFRIPGEISYVKGIVKDIVTPPSPQGIYLSKESWKELSKEFIPSALLSKSDTVNSEILKLPYIKEVMDIDSQYKASNGLLDSVTIITNLLIVAAILLGVVILYNLGILSYTERTREYATLKVLGFFQKEIRAFALRENILTTLAGWVVGIPIGSSFLKLYVKMVCTDTYEIPPTLRTGSFIIATLITIGCSIGVNLLLSRKVKKINMVEALKSIE